MGASFRPGRSSRAPLAPPTVPYRGGHLGVDEAHCRKPSEADGIRKSLRRSSVVSAAIIAQSVAYFCIPQARAQDVRPLTIEEANAVIAEIDSQMVRMRQDLDLVRTAYGAPLSAEVSRVERRFREGEIQFLLEDFLRASIIFLDVVEDPASRSHPRYDDCVYFLAESLRRSRNFSGARRYFEEVLPRARGERLKDVVLGLLEIAGATNDYRDVDTYVGRLRDAGTLSGPDVDYIYGKMLFRGAGNDMPRAQRALELFQRVPAGASAHVGASYYAGVALVRLGRFEEALQQFQATLERVPDEDVELRELTLLSLGRLYQETGDVEQSATAYQGIGHSSRFFPQMLYELAWAHVHQGNRSAQPDAQAESYARALRAIELLMATSPTPRLYPEARLLQGNLQIRLGGAESAYETFQSIVDRYGTARDRLANLLEGAPSTREFFDQLVDVDLEREVDLESVGTTILPPVAVAWAIEEEGMGRAIALQKDLTNTSAFLNEARELVAALEETLAGEGRYRMFPGLSAARSRAVSVENRIVVIQQRLLGLERQMVWPHLGLEERASIQARHQRVQSVEARARALPQTPEAVEAEREAIRGQYQAVELAAYRESYRIRSMKAQTLAVELWLNRSRGSLRPEEAELMASRLRAARGEIGALEETLGELEFDIRRGAAAALADAGVSGAGVLRADFEAALEAELAELAKHRASVPPDLQGPLLRLDQHRQTMVQLRADLSGLNLELADQVGVKVAELRDSMAREVSNLAGYQGEHAVLSQSTETLLGPVAERTLVSVGREFHDLVLKADVGIIDVAWARKQAETERVNSLIRELNERTMVLESEFSDVLRD